nr:unnamed protein product [Digitaria exilis]
MAVELGQQTVELGAMVRLAAEESYLALRELVERSRAEAEAEAQGKEGVRLRSDTEKKIDLLKFVDRTRQRMLRLHVLAKWCQQANVLWQGRWKDAIKSELISDSSAVQGGNSAPVQIGQDGELDLSGFKIPGLKKENEKSFENSCTNEVLQVRAYGQSYIHLGINISLGLGVVDDSRWAQVGLRQQPEKHDLCSGGRSDGMGLPETGAAGSGRLLLQSSKNILLPSALIESEEALNKGSLTATEVFVSLRTRSILHLFAATGRFLGLKLIM